MQYGVYCILRKILRAKKIFISIGWFLKTMIFFANHMRTNLYKSVKFCHFECRSKQNVGVMFTQMPNEHIFRRNKRFQISPSCREKVIFSFTTNNKICKIKWSIFVNAIQVKVISPYVPLNIHNHFIQYWEMIPISSFRV